jgi:hypothetical protein
MPPQFGDPDAPPSRAVRPVCPQCQRRMTVKQVSPVLFATELDDVIYGCEDCATEAKRTVKRA